MIQNVLMLDNTKTKVMVGPGPMLVTGPGLEPGQWLVTRSGLVAEPEPGMGILTYEDRDQG